jgi:hypothetical protein
LENKTDVSGW